LGVYSGCSKSYLIAEIVAETGGAFSFFFPGLIYSGSWVLALIGIHQSRVRFWGCSQSCSMEFGAGSFILIDIIPPARTSLTLREGLSNQWSTLLLKLAAAHQTLPAISHPDYLSGFTATVLWMNSSLILLSSIILFYSNSVSADFSKSCFGFAKKSVNLSTTIRYISTRSEGAGLSDLIVQVRNA
jgi:hypothetical protein